MNQYTHEKNRRYLQLREKYIKEALEIAAEKMVNYAKDNHPYTDRTGFLSDSISRQETQSSGNNHSIEIGAYMKYAEAVEYGTSRSAPYPFLLPAIETNRDFLQQIVDAAELKALRDAGLN